MSTMWLEKLVAYGHNGKTPLVSTVSFARHFTMIEGPSDSGKSLIYKSIDYLLGKKLGKTKEEKMLENGTAEEKSSAKDNPFSPLFPNGTCYDSLELTLNLDGDSFTLTRPFNSKKTNVEFLLVAGEKEGRYSLKEIDSFLLRRLGMETGLQIPKSKAGKMQALTWRSAKRYFLFSQGIIANENSILLPLQNTEKTASLSILLYLLGRKDFNEFNGEEAIKKHTRAVEVQAYLSGKVVSTAKEKEDLEAKLKANGLDPEDLGKLNATLQGMQDSLNEITDEFNSSIDTLQKINEDLANLEDSKTQEEINLVGYKKLKTQFDEDIERLGFIVNAGDVLAQAPTVRKCSFCGSEIHSPAGDAKDQQQRIESAQAELDKTLLQSNTLVLEINSATERLSKYDSDIEKKNLEKDSITDRLNKKLQPAKSDFEFKISQIQSYLDLKSQIGAIERQTKDIDADKKVYNPDDVKLVDYQPKGLFSKQFFEDLEQTFLSLLKEMKYQPLESCHFNPYSFNMELNGVDISKSHGEGYAGLLNATLALALYKASKKVDGAHFPGLLILDSPLKSLSLPEGTEKENDLRLHFYQTISKEASDGQIILLDNAREAESLGVDETVDGVEVIRFTQKQDNGRYGFLEGVRKN
jgi:energy-coupling factor transporter ATP-binding protein EcfA2